MGILKKISPFERKHLFIAWIALSISFTIAFLAKGGLVSVISNLVNGKQIGITGDLLLFAFLAALIIVGVSFILHELAHKFTAMKFGYWSEFRKSNNMLVISGCLAVLLGIVFAAPGATLISTDGKQLSRRENGLISLAGPVTNIILLILFAILMIIGYALGGGAFLQGGFGYVINPAGFIFYLGITGIMVNAMFAFFNLLPVGPLDGRKIMQWNPAIYIVILALSLFLLYASLDTTILNTVVSFFIPGNI